MRKKISNIKWEAIASTTAIVALLFSVYQFRKSVDISNQQLKQSLEQFAHQRIQDSIQLNLATEQFRLNITSATEQQDILNKQFTENIEILKRQSDALYSISEENRSLNRPNFFAQIAISPFDIKNPDFSIEYLFHNFGPRAAINFDGKIFVIPSDFAFHTLANVTSVSEITTRYSLSSKGKVANFTLLLNQIPVYFFVSLDYKNIVTQENYHQNFYFIWQGIKNGKYSNVCENLQFQDKELLDNYIKKNKLK